MTYWLILCRDKDGTLYSPEIETPDRLTVDDVIRGVRDGTYPRFEAAYLVGATSGITIDQTAFVEDMAAAPASVLGREFECERLDARQLGVGRYAL
jgi:hypothetical protein